jgi:hypothetical protein
MANTYIQIGSTVTVGAGGAASIDFTSIPSTYTDLLLKLSLRSSNADGFTGSATMRLNANSGANYSFRTLFAATATPASGNGSAGTSVTVGGTVGSSLTANTFNNAEIYLPNYAGSTNKSFSVDTVSENNASTDFTYQLMMIAGLWSQTTAINQITIYSGTVGSTNFLQYSTASLYGISKS